MGQQDQTSGESIKPGMAVYTEDGRVLGRISGFTDGGFEIEYPDPDDPDGIDLEELPGRAFGEGYLMWRCGECGEMGELDDGFPKVCPSCGAPREEISEVQED
jgi:hypothetical protein